jgi:bifunctional DNA-binding transcriptional regulator/antitoxin component of YhaV-PrlF toxin-antitoxin module
MIPYMSHTSTLTSKNQTTIPKAVVAALNIKPSATLCYDLELDGTVRLTAKTASFAGLAGTFPAKRSGKPASVAEMQAAVKSAAAKRFKRMHS